MYIVLVVLASPAVYGILECALRELHEILEDKIEMEDVGGRGRGGRATTMRAEGGRERSGQQVAGVWRRVGEPKVIGATVVGN